MNKAVFMDRDGVIIALNPKDEAFGFLLKQEEIIILPGVLEALLKFKEKNYLRIVITNQPAVARGLISEEEVKQLHRYINLQLNNLIDDFYFCPHHPEMHPDVPEHAKKYRIACNCRKPAPGMLQQAAKDFNIDLPQSWMIGDMISDIVMGQAAGCKTILIKSAANERVIVSSQSFDVATKPDYYVDTLAEAAKIIE